MHRGRLILGKEALFQKTDNMISIEDHYKELCDDLLERVEYAEYQKNLVVNNTKKQIELKSMAFIKQVKRLEAFRREVARVVNGHSGKSISHLVSTCQRWGWDENDRAFVNKNGGVEIV